LENPALTNVASFIEIMGDTTCQNTHSLHFLHAIHALLKSF